MRVIATAGHVDHGKSTLVRALTGTDPDRWREEQERGLTIDLGFATTELPAGPVSFVDVPGHERFLGNMLAGVGAVDACLFVVSAAEGWRAQSEEHLAILELLGVSRGVVALTHVDLLDPPARRAAVEAVRSRLAVTALADVEVVETGVAAGIGLSELRAALGRLVRATPPPADLGRPRLWIDRTFGVRGAGTVVTGTLTGGTFARGDRVVTLPGGKAGRIRSLQVHDAARDRVGPGHRVALNLPGLAVAQVGRGQAVVEPERWEPTARFDAEVTVLASARHPVGRRGAHLLHCGTGSWAVRVQVLGGPEIAPGTTGLARLAVPEALPLRPGDRFVIRDTGADATVAGGEVLDVAPVLPVGRARPDRRWERVVEEHGWITATRLARLTGVEVEPEVGPWVVDEETRVEGEHRLVAAVEAAGPAGLPLEVVDERQRGLLQRGIAGLVVDEGVVRRWGGGQEEDPWLAQARKRPFQPPSADDVAYRVLRGLVRRGHVVVLDGIAFPAEALPAAAEVLRGASDGTDGLTVAEIRDVLGTTRRFALALLGALDAAGVTTRHGDLRKVTPGRVDGEDVGPEEPPHP